MKSLRMRISITPTIKDNNCPSRRLSCVARLGIIPEERLLGIGINGDEILRYNHLFPSHYLNDGQKDVQTSDEESNCRLDRQRYSQSLDIMVNIRILMLAVITNRSQTTHSSMPEKEWRSGTRRSAGSYHPSGPRSSVCR